MKNEIDFRFGKSPLFSRSLFIFAVSAFAVGLSGCDRHSKDPNVELIQNMMESPAIKAQGYDPDVEDQRANLVPPEGTVPRGYTPYTIPDPDTAAIKVHNPFENKKTDVEFLTRGQRFYFTNCQVCHGPVGKGNGPVAEYLQLAPPSLVSQRARDFKDGYLYHMITMGRGLMGGYGSQIIKPEDRWALVNYLRQMQSKEPVFPAP
jgi:mono/diheme cytochrome c family protein